MNETPDLASLIREGDTIAWTSAVAEPTHLVSCFSEQLPRVPRSSLLLNLGFTMTLDARAASERLQIRALGGASTNRRFQEFGALDILPAHYGSLPDMVANGILPIDVVFLQMTADGAGYRLPLMIDYIADAVPRARVVVAEINDQAPVTYGDTEIDPAYIDHKVHVSHPLIEFHAPPPGDEERTIGAHIARLIPDGATLQVGLGAMPDAALQGLYEKKDLGLHSGTIGDTVADLVDAGVITNRRKPIDTGLCVTAGLLGTSRLYAWAHNNKVLRLKSPRYTHDNAVHAQIPKLIGVNSALEIDLTGQVNAEVAGGRHIGMVGGHGDFTRGCNRSPGGLAIVALESTARKGTVSRIVSKLSGGIVTTSRADAGLVVTEYGIADLRGRSVSERAKALIAVAHPDFRRSLQAESEKLI